MDTRTVAEIETDIKKLPGGATFPTSGMKKAQLLALEATLKGTPPPVSTRQPEVTVVEVHTEQRHEEHTERRTLGQILRKKKGH